MKAEDTVRYLSAEYYRECADEDGVIQRYRIPIHEPSFKAGYDEGIEAGDYYEGLVEGAHNGIREGVRRSYEYMKATHRIIDYDLEGTLKYLESINEDDKPS